MIGIVIFATCFFAIGLQVVIDREKGVYKRLKGTPINPFFVMSSLVIIGFITIFLGKFEIVVLAKLVFDVDVSSTLFQFLSAVTWSTLSFLGDGLFAGQCGQANAIGFGHLLYSFLPDDVSVRCFFSTGYDVGHLAGSHPPQSLVLRHRNDAVGMERGPVHPGRVDQYPGTGRDFNRQYRVGF
jgi:hypothetical protein